LAKNNNWTRVLNIIIFSLHGETAYSLHGETCKSQQRKKKSHTKEVVGIIYSQHSPAGMLFKPIIKKKEEKKKLQ
jgi:hypothetical protein